MTANHRDNDDNAQMQPWVKELLVSPQDEHLLCAQVPTGRLLLLLQIGRPKELFQRIFYELHICQDCATRYSKEIPDIIEKLPEFERTRFIYSISRIPTKADSLPEVNSNEMEIIHRTLSHVWNSPIVLRSFADVDALFTLRFVAFMQVNGALPAPLLDSKGSYASFALFPLHRNKVIRTYGKQGN